MHIGGRHVNGASPDALARIGVCTIPEGRGIFPNLTVRENLRMVTFGGVDQKEVEERAFSQFPRLGERRHQLLFLDELSMGLAPLLHGKVTSLGQPDDIAPELEAAYLGTG